jgi:hypothetical protein
MIRLSCPSCEKKLAVNDSLAGKSVKCPGCRGSIRVPGGPKAAAPAPRSAVASGPPRRAPRPAAEVDDGVPDDPDEERAPREPERKKRPKKRRKKNVTLSGLSILLILLAAAGGLYLVLTLVAVFVTAGTNLMLILGCILIVVGQIWFIYIARQEDTMVYLMVRFLPFYSIYYFFTRIHLTYKPFLAEAAGTLFLITGLVIGLVRGDFMDRHHPGWHDPPALQNLNPAQRHRLAEDLLKRPDKVEARAWLAGGRGRGALSFEPAETAQHVQALYARGAKEVIVANIDASDPDDEHAQRVVVVLPEDVNRRPPVFEYLRQALGSEETDTGQKYLVLD